MPDNVLAFLVALGVALLLTPAVIAFARRTGALDKPNARKVHVRPIPRIGGIGIYAAFMVSILVQLTFVDLASEYMTSLIGLMVGGTIIVAIGIIDDYCDLPAKVKLLGQIIAAAVVVIGFDVRIDVITDPLGDYIYLEFLAIPATIFWIVGLTNTVNLIDGLDGLAAGVSSIAALTIFLVAMEEGIPPVAMVTIALAGAARLHARGHLRRRCGQERGDHRPHRADSRARPADPRHDVCHRPARAQPPPDLQARQGTSAPPPSRTRVQSETGGAAHVCSQRAVRPVCTRSDGGQHPSGGTHHTARRSGGIRRRAQAGHPRHGCAAEIACKRKESYVSPSEP